MLGTALGNGNVGNIENHWNVQGEVDKSVNMLGDDAPSHDRYDAEEVFHPFRQRVHHGTRAKGLEKASQALVQVEARRVVVGETVPEHEGRDVIRHARKEIILNWDRALFLCCQPVNEKHSLLLKGTV